ncbi:hypothetical protein [Flavobacterium caeni]|nr:hypothetical protein [Flavobacterium caeni]
MPLFAGYSYASPNLVGANMALIGALVTLGLIVRRKRLVTQVV